MRLDDTWFIPHYSPLHIFTLYIYLRFILMLHFHLRLGLLPSDRYPNGFLIKILYYLLFPKLYFQPTVNFFHTISNL
jgi:hypothetical protein